MENWKERFEYIYVIEENKGEKYLRKYDHTTIVEELEHFISQELDKAREEGFNDGVEKTVGIIQKELDELLLEKDDEKFWVGDILRDCGYSVESILPKNMKGYLVKLKDNK